MLRSANSPFVPAIFAVCNPPGASCGSYLSLSVFNAPAISRAPTRSAAPASARYSLVREKYAVMNEPRNVKRNWHAMLTMKYTKLESLESTKLAAAHAIMRARKIAKELMTP